LIAQHDGVADLRFGEKPDRQPCTLEIDANGETGFAR